jgi:NADH-quinone oxidoreductase subunit I
MQAVDATQPPPSPGAAGAGLGLVRGLATTARALLRPATTQEYPDVEPELPPRSRGVIALVEENCTVCMLCARECPDWCIYIDSHKETLPAVEGGRERQRNVLDRFAIDFSLCMYCGICIEVCPFDALFWSPEFEYAEYDIADLTHEKERLREWMWTVPAPPAQDPAAEEPKELAAAEKALAKASGAAAAPAEGDAPVRERPVRRAAGERPARRTAEAPDAAEDGPARRTAEAPASSEDRPAVEPAGTVAPEVEAAGAGGQPSRDDPTMPSSAENTAEQAAEADSASEPEGGGPT